MRRLLKEPLLHFLVLGAALFGLFYLVGQKEAEPAKIVVSAARIENLANGFARTRQRSPSPGELAGLVEDYIRDEVFYREGKAARLDRDDTVIRRRLRQKMEFMAEDIGTAEPSDEQLSAYLTANAERFENEDRLTFSHVYLSAARREALESDAKSAAAALASGGKDTTGAALGDHFMLGDAFDAMPRSDIARSFGEHFTAQLFKLEPGRWQGPIASSYGMHVVRVTELTQGGPMPLDSVRSAVRREWMNARRLEADSNLYRTLRARYQIEVEGVPAEKPAGKAKSEVTR